MNSDVLWHEGPVDRRDVVTLCERSRACSDDDAEAIVTGVDVNKDGAGRVNGRTAAAAATGFVAFRCSARGNNVEVVERRWAAEMGVEAGEAQGAKAVLAVAALLLLRRRKARRCTERRRVGRRPDDDKEQERCRSNIQAVVCGVEYGHHHIMITFLFPSDIFDKALVEK